MCVHPLQSALSSYIFIYTYIYISNFQQSVSKAIRAFKSESYSWSLKYCVFFIGDHFKTYDFSSIECACGD